MIGLSVEMAWGKGQAGWEFGQEWIVHSEA
jgi:hypothetical protein